MIFFKGMLWCSHGLRLRLKMAKIGSTRSVPLLKLIERRMDIVGTCFSHMDINASSMKPLGQIISSAMYSIKKGVIIRLKTLLVQELWIIYCGPICDPTANTMKLASCSPVVLYIEGKKLSKKTIDRPHFVQLIKMACCHVSDSQKCSLVDCCVLGLNFPKQIWYQQRQKKGFRSVPLYSNEFRFSPP